MAGVVLGTPDQQGNLEVSRGLHDSNMGIIQRLACRNRGSVSSDTVYHIAAIIETLMGCQDL